MQRDEQQETGEKDSQRNQKVAICDNAPEILAAFHLYPVAKP
jgi:hypothetical protein